LKVITILPISCQDSSVCSADILSKLKSEYPGFDNGNNGHLSILHLDGAHKIWFFAYSENNMHESMIAKTNKVRKKKVIGIKKYTAAKTPTKERLDTILMV